MSEQKQAMEKVHQPADLPKALNPMEADDDTSLNAKKFPYGRYCHIVKRPDFDGYGFNLHSEKIKPGQYIGKVDPDSPAEAAGLREGDQIIEVNGVNIGVETHKQVVQRIKAISNEVRLFLIDPSTESIANLDKSNNKSSNNNTTSKIINSCESQAVTTPIVPMATSINPKSQNDDRIIDEASSLNPKSSEDSSYVSSTTKTITITNGKSSSDAKDPSEVVVPPPPSPSEQQMKMSSSTQNSGGLNLNLTAAEMRAKLLSKKKFDPKNDSVDLKKKFDIIQKL